MRTARVDEASGPPRAPAGVLCPFSLTVEPVARCLRCELVDDPTYDSLELQYFDDSSHGTGMLAFLSRRADRRVDYYHEPGLQLDPAGYAVGAGLGEWTETTFAVARLHATDDGVDAEARFTDVAGRAIEVHVDDRDGRASRRTERPALQGAAVERPHALLLVPMQGVELVQATGAAAVIRIDGRAAATRRLPGARLHGRRLPTHAAPLGTAQLNANHEGPVPVVDPAAPGAVELAAAGAGIAAVTARQGEHHARFALTPAVPDLNTLPQGVGRQGRWTVDVNGTRVTGGAWSVRRRGSQVDLALEVTQRPHRGSLPPLRRLVGGVVPALRRWRTRYRWVATVQLADHPTMVSCWGRTTVERGRADRRATRRAAGPRRRNRRADAG